MVEYSDYREGCIAFLQKLVQTPSINGQENEGVIAQVIGEEARKLGLSFQVDSKDLARPNIFVGEGFDDNRSLLFVAHTDTVRVGDPNSWEFAPFSGTIREGRLYGRGAVDCKGGVALSIYALKILKDLGRGSAAKFVGVADEESGADSNLGLRYFLEKGLRAKAAIYTYGGGKTRDFLIIGHRGLVRLWVTCLGESAHSGSKDWQDKVKGENAIMGMVDLLQELNKFTFPGTNKYFPGYHFILTPTLIEGGQGESMVPDHSRVLLDIRTLPEQQGEDVITRITEITRAMTQGKRSYEVVVKTNIPAALTDPQSEFVQKAQRLSKEIFGIEPTLSGSGPANEGYMLITRNIPTITGYGPLGGNYHSPNEYADLSSISDSLRFLAEIALN